jgi:hypothetical protein
MGFAMQLLASALRIWLIDLTAAPQKPQIFWSH